MATVPPQVAPTQEELKREFRAFCDREIRPFANDWDIAQRVPRTLIDKVADAGYLGWTVPVEFGGRGMDQLSWGWLNAEIGAACSSVRSLLTVHGALVAETLSRWGTKEQKARWLPRLCSGTTLAAFGLSEPGQGSDAKNVQTTYRENGGTVVLNGTKKWTTFGQLADLFLVFANGQDGPCAFLVEKDSPGLEIVPINGMVGTRASMLAQLNLKDCEVPAENLLGRKGWGFLQIANTALDNGRFSVAWGSLGIAMACLEESVSYANQRSQFGELLREHQLIKRKVAEMIVEVKAAEALCVNAAKLRDEKAPDALMQTQIAKYHAARTAMRNAQEAVQVHGAAGCHESHPVQRYFRDAKIMEIIEGTSEIQQILIADYGFNSLESLF